jgi:hypothetical protein
LFPRIKQEEKRCRAFSQVKHGEPDSAHVVHIRSERKSTAMAVSVLKRGILFACCAFSNVAAGVELEPLHPCEFTFSLHRDETATETLRLCNRSGKRLTVVKVLKGCSCTTLDYQPGSVDPNGLYDISVHLDVRGYRVGSYSTDLLLQYASYNRKLWMDR